MSHGWIERNGQPRTSEHVAKISKHGHRFPAQRPGDPTVGYCGFNNIQLGTFSVTGAFVTKIEVEIGIPNAPDGHYAGAVPRQYVSLQGPQNGVGTCRMTYSNPSAGGSSESFTYTFQFKVVDATSFIPPDTACAVPT